MLRAEHPRPQFVRNEWQNLNGEWEFEIDHGKSGKERKRYQADKLDGTIVVPFCPESELSGVGHKDFMAAVWYKREFELSPDWDGKRILLHFGAVDYAAEVWVNGQTVGTHQGGYTPFTIDISQEVKQGSNTLVVYAEDDVRSGCSREESRAGRFTLSAVITRGRQEFGKRSGLRQCLKAI